MPRSEADRAEAHTRRLLREAKRAEKRPDRSARCGVNYYSQSPEQRRTGFYWRNCHRCGRLLDYQQVAVERECVPPAPPPQAAR